MPLTTVNPGLLDSQAQYTGFKNRLINGQMMIDQRNAGASVSLTTTFNYATDRFGAQTNVGSGHTMQRSTTAPTGFSNSYLITIGTGGTPVTNNYGRLRQTIEGFNTADLAWGTANAQPVTLSFLVRSSVTGTFGVAFANANGTSSYIASYVISAANTWEQKSITIAGDTSNTWATDNTGSIQVAWDIGEGPDRSKAAGSWGAMAGSGYGLTGGTKLVATTGATFYITGVQLEKGSTATSFDYRPYGTELQLCYRYFYKYINDRANGTFAIPMQAYSSSDAFGHLLALPVTMRTAPTCATSGTFTAINASGSVTTAFTTKNIDYPTSQFLATGGWSGSSGLVGGNMVNVRLDSGTYITASAEL